MLCKVSGENYLKTILCFCFLLSVGLCCGVVCFRNTQFSWLLQLAQENISVIVIFTASDMRVKIKFFTPKRGEHDEQLDLEPAQLTLITQQQRNVPHSLLYLTENRETVFRRASELTASARTVESGQNLTSTDNNRRIQVVGAYIRKTEQKTRQPSPQILTIKIPELHHHSSQ